MTTAPSTIMPKSIAPIESRFAGMCAQSRQMKEKSSANGIVTATISAVRTLNRNRPSTTSTSTMPRSRFRSTVLGRLVNQLGAVVVRHDLDVRRQDACWLSVVGHRLDLLQDHLRLLADAHQDHALDGVRSAACSRTARAAARARSSPSPTSLIVHRDARCASRRRCCRCRPASLTSPRPRT